MKLKTVEVEGKTYAEVQDGKPVFVEDDGKEIAFDAPGTRQTISRLNGEAQGHREQKEKAQADLKAFEGINPTEAREAMEKVKKIDDKQLIDAGKVDEVRAEITKGFETKLAEANAATDAANGALQKALLSNAFANSKFIGEKVAVPAEMIQAQFGDNFSIGDNGAIQAKDAAGNTIYSKENPGNVAGFDEAIEIIIEGYAYKDHLLKGSGASGGGSEGGDDGGSGGDKKMKRADFEKLAPGEKAAKMKDGFTLVD